VTGERAPPASTAASAAAAGARPEPVVGAAGGYELPTFPYRRAPELDGARPLHPVAVVGAGLAGLAAACDLASRGVPVVLLDDDDTVGVRGASSRGICYAQKTLEIFDRLAIYERLAARGATWSVGRVLRNDVELYSFDLLRSASARQPPFINLQQFYVEWALADLFHSLPGADPRWRHSVLSAVQGPGRVTLEVETPDGRYALEAAWVVDCSGVGSRLRASLGVRPRTAQGIDRWCISDVRLAGSRPRERWTWIEAPFNEGRAVWQHEMADGVWRLDYQMPPDSDPTEVSRPEVVRERLDAHFGPDAVREIVWVGPYSYRTQILDSFREGRVFFAGDAAHAFSPFGARGGNSGVQDAENLAWKLAAVVHGEAPERLLDSYDAERRPAAAHNIRLTDRKTRFLAPRSAFEKALRQAVLDLAVAHPFARALTNMGRMSDPFVYAASPLTTNGGEAVPNVAVELPSGASGALSDLLRGEGIRFLLLVFPDGAPADLPAHPRLAAYAVGEPVDDLPVLGGSAIRALGAPGEILLIRPDQHLAARFVRPSGAEIAAALRRALGEEAHG